MKTVIGVAGKIGSGKGTFVKILKELIPQAVIKQVRSGEILAETLDLWNIPTTRENLQNLFAMMDKTFGTGALSRAMGLRIEKTSEDIVIFDGVRRETDFRAIRQFKNNILVYIVANPALRFQRIKERNEKVGESEITFEQFLKQDEAESEREIYSIGNRANFRINNNDSLENFREEVKWFIRQFLLNPA